jgi:uncharacterized protein (TIGR02996 family)
MTEDAALFAAALAEPEDATVRLILADWFDDHDEPELARALRTVPEMMPFLAGLVRWDRPPGRATWWWNRQSGRDESDEWDKHCAARLVVRYRSLFPTAQGAPTEFDQKANRPGDPSAAPSPTAFLSRWRDVRQRQIAGLREKAARRADRWRDWVDEFRAANDPETIEYHSCLLHELVLREHNVPAIAGGNDHYAAMRLRNHPLAWLLPELLPVEAGISLYLPRFGPTAWGTNVSEPTNLSPPPDRSASLASRVIGAENPSPNSAAWAAVRGWQEESNGKLEAWVLNLDEPAAPDHLGAAWIRRLGDESLSDLFGPGLRIVPVTPAPAWQLLFCCAQSGGAYGRREWGAYGRLHAWQSFGWLAGVDHGMSMEWVAHQAQQCAWFSLGGTDWFFDLAWDLGLIALRPDRMSLAILAATDTD